MILFSNAALLIAALATGAAKRWQTYYNTILLVLGSNLLYNYLCRDRMTWMFHPEAFLSHKLADLMNTFVLLPATTVLYLHFYPNGSRKKVILYYFGWIAGFCAMEYAWHLLGTITYHHGWTFFWSIGFYVVMFFVIRLHQSHPGKALLVSLLTVLFLTIWFEIPLFD